MNKEYLREMVVMVQLVMPIRMLMAKKGVRTMVDLEEKTGVSRQVLDRLDKGKSKRLDFDTVIKLCKFFECSPGELLYIDNQKED
jgi:putative transcriptional regulator